MGVRVLIASPVVSILKVLSFIPNRFAFMFAFFCKARLNLFILSRNIKG